MLNRTIEHKNAPAAPGGPTDVKALIEQMSGATAAQLKELNERIDGLELKAKRPGAGSPDNNDVLVAERKALTNYIRTGDKSEFKTLSVGSDPDGGYTVSSALSPQMLKRIYDQSPMRRLSRVVTIGDGDAFEEPIDKGDVGASWVGERASRPATSTTNLGLMRVPVNEVYALQPITQRLLDDSRFDLAPWIEGKIADKFGRTEGEACVNGDGVEKPMGFLQYPVATTADASRAWGTLQYVVSGSAATPADADGQANGIKDLLYALRTPYIKNARWLMRRSTANAIDKLKDSTKNYIWRTGMTSGAPPDLLGHPVEFDENMPEIGANTFPIAFGDFGQGYIIVDKLGIRPIRDNLTDKPNVLFYAYRRVGGQLANSEAIKLLKCST